jgi:hypothetical protein
MNARNSSRSRHTHADLSGEERLVLALVRQDDADEAEPIRTMAARADSVVLTELLGRLRVLTLLGSRLRATAPGTVPDALARAIDAQTLAARRLGGIQQTVAEAVLARLAAAGVAAAPLKGALLAQAVHGDVGLRLAGDVDILVAPQDLRTAAGVVEDMGWLAPLDWTDRDGWPLLHFAMNHPHGLPPVELHWRVHFYERDFAVAALARAAPDAPALRLSDVDTLACLALCYARDGLAGLRLAADAIAVWGRMGRPEAPLAALYADHEPLQPALAAAGVALARIAGEPDDRFVGAVTLPAGARRSLRLADPLLRMSGQQRLADIALVDLLLAPPGGRRAALERQVLPPVGLLRRHSSRLAAAGPGRLARARVEHPVRLLRRFALGRMRRHRRPTALAPRR